MCNLSKGVEEKGIQKGFQKGIEKGIAEGKAKERRKIIQAMLKNGLTIEQIIKICDVTKEEVEEIKAQVKKITAKEI